MRDKFHESDSMQRRLRDTILVTKFYQVKYDDVITLDGGGDVISDLQIIYGIDTIVKNHGEETITFEEKIVKWKGKKYNSICFETWSCTVPSLKKLGWAHPTKGSNADKLIYCMETKNGDLDCILIHQFQKLKEWFWPRQNNYNATITNQRNHTECRLVPIDDIMDSFKDTKRFLLRKD